MDWNNIKIFCFTGKLTLFTRNEARSYVQKAGYKWSADVTKDVDYLVMADPKSTSLKAKRARALGIQLLSETEFMDMIHVSENQVVEKKAEDEIKKAKAPTTWKKCFKCALKNLGLRSHEKWRDYDYDKGCKNDFVVTVYYLVNADLPNFPQREIHIAESNRVYGKFKNWYGNVTVGWSVETTNDPEIAYKNVLTNLFNPYRGYTVERQSYIASAISSIKQQQNPRSKQPIPDIPSIEFDSPDELQLMMASYGWNVDIDE